MPDSEEDNASDSNEPGNKNRKRKILANINDDTNDNVLSHHSDANDSQPSSSSTKKRKLNLNQRMKKLRDKKDEYAEFLKLPDNKKKEIYQKEVTEKNLYQKKMESENKKHQNDLNVINEGHQNDLKFINEEHQNDLKTKNEENQNDLKVKNEKHQNDFKVMDEKHQNDLKAINKEHQNDLKLEKARYQKEMELEKEKYQNELNVVRRKFQNEKEIILNDLNMEKIKVKQMEQQLSKVFKNKSTQTEKTKVCTASVQTKKAKKIAKNFNDLNSRTAVSKRLNQADEALRKIASQCFTGNEEIEKNKKILDKNTAQLLKKLVKRYGMTTYRRSKLNTATTAFIFKHCRINVGKGRLLRRLLKEENAFASEREVNKMYAEFDKEIKIVETEIMVGTERIIVSEVDNLEEVLTIRAQRKLDNGNLLQNPLDANKLSFAFFGDDGGGSFKGGISIGECENQNSPDNFTPVVVFNGKSTKDIIYAACERVAAKIEKIEKITVKVNGEDRVFEIEWSLGGDYEFDLHCCGRKGCGSNCYCIYCLFKRKTRLFKEETSLEKGETRVNFDPLPDDEGYDRPPLFKKILPFFVLLCMLHLFLGIGLMFINGIEEILKQLDYDALTPEEKEEYELKMGENDKQIKETKNNVDLLKQTVEEKTLLIDAINDIVDLKLTEEDMMPISGCCMKTCAEKLGYESGHVVYCTCCKTPKGYHQLCLGTAYCKTNLKCINVEKYAKKGGILSNTSKVISKLQKEIDGIVVKRIKAQMKLDGLLIKKFDDMGENMKEYNDILMELNVSKQAWYQTFTGNHMRLLLKKANIFERLSAINQSDKLKHLVKALCLLKKIQDYTEARYLKDEEIVNLKIDVENIKNHMKENLGDFSVIPKFHILIHHVVEIAEIRKTIGLFTEQQIEHVHAIFNTELRRAKFLRKEKRNSWLMKEMYRRNAMKDAFGGLADAEIPS